MRPPPDEHGRDPERLPGRAMLWCVLAALAAGSALFSGYRAAETFREDSTDAARTARLQAYTEVSGDAPSELAADRKTPAVAGKPSAADVTDALSQDREVDAAAQADVPSGAAIVDFPAVIAQAPDTRAWIRIPGTDIHYPVVQASDNDYYLTHGPDGALSRSGAIFLSAANADDFTDRNTILYGHRMNSGTMFAQLHSFSDKAFLDKNPFIYITMPDGRVLTYEIFCVQKIRTDETGSVYRTQFENSAVFADWLGRKRSGVLAARAIALAQDAPVLTLSTCVRGDGESRLIVQAQRTESSVNERKETE